MDHLSHDRTASAIPKMPRNKVVLVSRGRWGMSEAWNTYLISYGYDGANWQFEIKARSQREAERMLQCIKMNARYDGELMATLPVPEKVGNWFARWWNG